jgi:hypothetical protein
LSEEDLKTRIRALLESVVSDCNFIDGNIDYLNSKYDLATISDLNVVKDYLSGVTGRIKSESDTSKVDELFVDDDAGIVWKFDVDDSK